MHTDRGTAVDIVHADGDLGEVGVRLGAVVEKDLGADDSLRLERRHERGAGPGRTRRRGVREISPPELGVRIADRLRADRYVCRRSSPAPEPILKRWYAQRPAVLVRPVHAVLAVEHHPVVAAIDPRLADDMSLPRPTW
jgi:hypothetical protein